MPHVTLSYVCTFSILQSLNVEVSCEGGDIVSETLLQGNTTVSTTGSGVCTLYSMYMYVEGSHKPSGIL